MSIAIAAALLTGKGEAQTVSHGAEHGVAVEHAPMIWLAPGEIAYPMLPHAFAFDGIDNDEDGCVDLEDADEVQALLPPNGVSSRAHAGRVEQLLIRLRDLRARLLRDESIDLREFATAPPSKDCRKTVDLERFKLCRRDTEGVVTCGPDAVVLANAEQHAPLETMGLRAAQKGQSVGWIQYWMYYPWDAEHLHDGEHMSVFYDGDDVLAVVGAGHKRTTANNIVVAAGRPQTSTELRFPDTIPQHVPILVELGKHASAPDVNCNGRFDIGQDANILPTGAWGTRDANVGVGKSEWAGFMPWESFDRRSDGLLVEASALAEPQQSRRIQAYERACPSPSAGQSVVAEILRKRQRTPRTTYRIVNALAAKEFFEAAALATSSDAVLKHAAYAELIGHVPASTAVDLQSTRRWKGNAPSCAARSDVWNHCDFGKPSNDFKLDILPRIAMAAVHTWEGGNARAGLAVRIAGVPLIRDSSFEVQVLLDNLHFWRGNSVAEHNRGLLGTGGKGHKLELAAFYNAFSTSHRGPYVGVSYRRGDLDFNRARLVPNGQETQGASSDVVVIEQHGSNINLEAGYAIRLPLDIPIYVRAGVSGPTWRKIVNPPESDGLRYFQRPTPAEVRISVQVDFLKLLRRRHPLADKYRLSPR